MTKTPPMLYRQCPFCGKPFKTIEPHKQYCDRCIKNGYHWLHETLGKTNGWNKKVA